MKLISHLSCGWVLTVAAATMLVGNTVASADAVADRQGEYLNNFYDTFRNSSDVGTDIGRTINLVYTGFALNKDSADIAALNTALGQVLNNATYWDGRQGQDLATVSGYWELPSLASMVTDSNLKQHLSASNQAKAKAFLVNFSDNIDTDDRPSVHAGDRNRIFESGNHDLHVRAVAWSTAQIVKDDPAYANHTFVGGDTAEQRYGKWTTNLLDYFQNRAGKGGSVEVASPVYQSVYMNAAFHIAQSAEDSRLREVARTSIDLHFADIAMESTEGIRGGAKSRAAKNRVLNAGNERSVQYIYPFVGLPEAGLSELPTGAQLGRILGGMLHTDYRLREEIIDMMSNDDARGTYTYNTSRMGEGTRTTEHGEFVYDAGTGQSSMMRSTRVTSEYTLGWATIDESKSYMAISGQARAMGAITDASRDSRLIVNLSGATTGIDELQGIGHGDAMLVRRQFGKNTAEAPRVYISSDFTYSQEPDGWFFGTDTSGSFFALKGVLPTGTAAHTVGDPSSDLGNGDYIQFTSPNAVVVLQMGLASDYVDLAAFTADVRDNTLTYAGGAVTYNPGTSIKLFDNATLPQVGGHTVDLTPSKVYDSPYLNADYGATAVTFTDLQGNSFDLDFNYNPVADTQQIAINSTTTLTSAVFSPGYREMVGVTEFSSNDAGPLTYTIGPTGVLQIDVDGHHNVFDRLIVNGTLQLGGELLINSIRDTPTLAGVYQLFEADTITGSFASITLPTAGTGLTWKTDDLAIDGTIALLQAMSITYGDANTTYSASSPDDNPPVDAAFFAAIQALSPNFDRNLGLDEGGINEARAMTFFFEPIDPAQLESAVLTIEIQGLSGYENDTMRLDSVDNVRLLNTLTGFETGGGLMTLAYQFTEADLALLYDGQLNLAFIDDTLVDQVTLSWTLNSVAVPEPGTMILASPLLLLLLLKSRRGYEDRAVNGAFADATVHEVYVIAPGTGPAWCRSAF